MARRILVLAACCTAVASFAQTPGRTSPRCAAAPSAASYAGRGQPRYRDALFRGVTVRKDIVFSDAANDQGEKVFLRLDLYEPAEDTAPLRPAVLLIHGGSFTHLSKAEAPIPRIANELARRGYVAVALDYRLRANTVRPIGATIDDCVADALAALAWMEKNAGAHRLDMGHVAAAGESAGGIIAGHLAERAGSALFATILLWAGLFNPVYPNVKVDIGPCYPPAAIICGTEDNVLGSALDTAKVLDRAGVYHRLHRVEDGTHGLGQWEREYLSMMVEFLYDRLTVAGAPQASAAYEAESYSRKLRAVFSDESGGYNGTGAMRLLDERSYLEWNYVEVPAAGAYELAVRYANTTGRDQAAAVLINGSEAGKVRFPSTRQGEWKTARTDVGLNAGKTVLRLVAAQTPGGLVLDRFGVARR